MLHNLLLRAEQNNGVEAAALGIVMATGTEAEEEVDDDDELEEQAANDAKADTAVRIGPVASPPPPPPLDDDDDKEHIDDDEDKEHIDAQEMTFFFDFV
jgi:hypothetical protein